jgi:hypothetical protein
VVVHALHQKLAPGCIPVFASDGLNLYFSALTAQFGQWVAGVGRPGRASGMSQQGCSMATSRSGIAANAWWA